MTNIMRHIRALILLRKKINSPKIPRIINVTTVSTCANNHEDCPDISNIFTKKSSLISRSTSKRKLPINNKDKMGAYFLNKAMRAL